MIAKDLLTHESANIAALFKELLNNSCILKDDEVTLTQHLNEYKVQIIIQHSFSMYDIEVLYKPYIKYYSFRPYFGMTGLILTISIAH